MSVRFGEIIRQPLPAVQVHRDGRELEAPMTAEVASDVATKYHALAARGGTYLS